jgi:hypothetical protein
MLLKWFKIVRGITIPALNVMRVCRRVLCAVRCAIRAFKDEYWLRKHPIDYA